MEEKKTIVQKVEAIGFVVAVVLIILTFWLSLTDSNTAFVNFSYWAILSFIIYVIIRNGLSSHQVMRLAFTLTILGIILTTFGFSDFAEGVLKLSFIGWVLGIVQALIEYRKEHG